MGKGSKIEYRHGSEQKLNPSPEMMIKERHYIIDIIGRTGFVYLHTGRLTDDLHTPVQIDPVAQEDGGCFVQPLHTLHNHHLGSQIGHILLRHGQNAAVHQRGLVPERQSSPVFVLS
jgi:hypothetical protein